MLTHLMVFIFCEYPQLWGFIQKLNAVVFLRLYIIQKNNQLLDQHIMFYFPDNYYCASVRPSEFTQKLFSEKVELLSVMKYALEKSLQLYQISLKSKPNNLVSSEKPKDNNSVSSDQLYKTQVPKSGVSSKQKNEESNSEIKGKCLRQNKSYKKHSIDKKAKKIKNSEMEKYNKNSREMNSRRTRKYKFSNFKQQDLQGHLLSNKHENQLILPLVGSLTVSKIIRKKNKLLRRKLPQSISNVQYHK